MTEGNVVRRLVVAQVLMDSSSIGHPKLVIRFHTLVCKCWGFYQGKVLQNRDTCGKVLRKWNKERRKEMGEEKEFCYDDLFFFDVLLPIQRQLDNGTFWIGHDGLIHYKNPIAHNSPWLFGKRPGERKCRFWAQIVFAYYKFVPKQCFGCWKVVGHPKDFDEAVRVWQFQKELGIASKTGMEQRDYSGGLGGWSSFWYAPLNCGLDEARKFHQKIDFELKREFGDEALSTILKRGCTEMERDAGPTDTWIWRPEFEIKQQLIKASFAPTYDADVPKMLEVNIKRRWIEWAAVHGDKSYTKYGNKEIIRGPVRYDESIHSAKDFPILEELGKEKWDGNDRDAKPGSNKCERSSKSGNGSKPEHGLVLV